MRENTYDSAMLSRIAGNVGISTNIYARNCSPESTLMRGIYRRTQIRRGLYLHTGRAVEYENFVSESIIPAGISFIFFLCGSVEIDIGERRFLVGKQGQIVGTVINRTQAEAFRRRSHHNQTVRQVVVTITPEWLDSDENAGWHSLRRFDLFVRTHLAMKSWTPDARIVAILEQLLREQSSQNWIQTLQLESLVLALIAASIDDLYGEHAEEGALLRNREAALTAKFNDFIEANLGEKWSNEEISRNIGASVSVMKRLTRKNYDMSLSEYIRFKRLSHARTLLIQGRSSIEEISAQVGYSSAANFTTAFKELFGDPPHSFRKKLWQAG